VIRQNIQQSKAGWYLIFYNVVDFSNKLFFKLVFLLDFDVYILFIFCIRNKGSDEA